MSNDLNNCQFIGRLGKEPEVKYLQSGDAVCNFTLAVGWKSKDKEGAEWVNVTAFGKLGEVCGQYLHKGSQVFVQGRFKTDKYTDKNGVEKYSTKIQADKIQFLGKNEAADAIAPVAQAPAEDNSDIPF
ncbi:single-stranded DNA-binding protein [Flavobacterium sp.]|jgi:single-strand DNA-binding protein|uniref:single-stranded DNA-binding protein n=1 Tax=Flavobacterium sp. TaxID=239 RepID=UPI0037C13C0C